MKGRISDERRAKLEACRDCGIKPLPCPFCGKPALIYGTNLVGCSDTVNCGGEVDFGHWTGIENGIYAEHHVIQQWNKRHELQQSRALVSELRAENERLSEALKHEIAEASGFCFQVMRYRGLVSELRALAERMSAEWQLNVAGLMNDKCEGAAVALAPFVDELSSLLSAHDKGESHE